MIMDIRDSTSFYRARVINHIERAYRHHNWPVIHAYLSRATDADVEYWGKHFIACRRLNDHGKIMFRLRGGQLCQFQSD